MFEVTITQLDKDTARFNITVPLNTEPRPGAEHIIKAEVEAYTGFTADVIVSPLYKEANIIVYPAWDPASLGDDLRDLIVAAGYAREYIEKEAKK